MKVFSLIILSLIMLASCAKEPNEPEQEDSSIYFPSSSNSDWAKIAPSELGWSEQGLAELYDFLEEKDSRAFLILKDGKIVVEEYWNKGLLGLNFNENSNWYWASAAKTLTSFLIGKAEEEGKIDLLKASSDYLGKNWSSLTAEQEAKISVLDHLRMTTGLDDTNGNVHCTDSQCLTYLAEPGTRWAYHNGPYTILDGILEGGTGQDFDSYFEENLKNKIAMDGFWTYQGYNHLYFSTAKSMARFALLILNEGKWKDEKIIDNQEYLRNSISPSQDINPSYGYLWWLNGKEKHMLPGLQIKFNSDITPNAPDDMYAAMGKNAQFINIVPSENLIVIRMGGSPDDALVQTSFQNEVWERLNIVMNK